MKLFGQCGFEMKSILLSRPASCLLLAVLAGLLAGCSYFFGDEGLFPNRSDDYLEAEQAKPLEIPAHLATDQVADSYPIPQLQYAKLLPKKYVVPRVDPVDELESKGSVKIQRFNGDQWILVKRSPSQTWPLLLQFLESNQVALRIAAVDRGLIETDWLTVESDDVGTRVEKKRDNKEGDRQVKAVPGGRERYQFLLKQGVQQNSTEIWVQQTLSGDFSEFGGGWTASSDLARQENMTTLVAEHLAGSPDQSSHSLLAQGIGSASKVSLEYDNLGEPYLDLKLPFDRGWASLQLALEKASFEVSDRNRSEGAYYARYVEQKKKQKKPGFFRRLLGFSTNTKKKSNQEANILVKAIEYQGSVLITISRIGEPVLAPNEQAFMLRKILNKLS